MTLAGSITDIRSINGRPWFERLRSIVKTRRLIGSCIASVGLLNVLLIGSVSAQSAVKNGDFDRDLSDWGITNSKDISAVWSPSDSAGAPGSGSAELRDMFPGGGGVQIILYQCISLSNQSFPVPWEVSAQVDVENEDWVTAWVFFAEYSDDQCMDYTGIDPAEIVNASDPAWQTVSGDYNPVAPLVGSVRLELAIEKPGGAGTGGVVRFDGISFGTSVDELFSDRFQSPP